MGGEGHVGGCQCYKHTSCDDCVCCYHKAPCPRPAVASTEGLFRVPGNKVRVERLMEALNHSDWAALADDGCCYKPHDFASALKHYLAHLPEPLLPGNHLEAYLQAAGQYKCTHTTLPTPSHSTTTSPHPPLQTSPMST